MHKRAAHMKKVQVPRPLRTQCHFLETTPQLPQQIIQHLQNRTPNKKPTESQEETHIPPPLHTPTKIANMDMGPDLYDTDSSNPQRRSSSSGKSDSSSRSRTQTYQPAPNIIVCGSQHVRTAPAPATVTPISSSAHNSSSRLWYQFAQASGNPDYACARPCWKARLAACKLCRRHEMCYSSAYTRPSEDMLREILEVRYPLPDGSEDEDTPLLRKVQKRSCWWHCILGKGRS